MKNISRKNKSYSENTHFYGRIWSIVSVVMMMVFPIVAGIVFDAWPTASAIGIGIMGILIYWAAGAVEFISYTPLLGATSIYLGFVTGNLSNLKIPCVVKAHEIAETELGTEENELVSTIAVAISSLVTVLIIAVMVLCLAVSPLQQSIEKAPYLTPAFGCVVYALFGSLGGKYIVKNPKMAAIPGAILIGLSALISGVSHGKTNIGSLSLMVGIVFCALFAFAQIMINKKKAKKAAATETIDVGIDSDEKVEVVLEDKAEDETEKENQDK